MDRLDGLLAHVLELADSPENRERESRWQGDLSPREESADFYRGMPARGQSLCLASLPHEEWETIFPGFDLRLYYTRPEYYLEHYWRKYLYYFEVLGDDRPLRKSIAVFHNTIELSLFGAETLYWRDRHPWIRGPVIREPEDLDGLSYPDFYASGLMPHVHSFYDRLRELVGDAFQVTFPRWRLGLFGTALHLRGAENLLSDMLLNPEFAHRLMAFVTESRLRWERERARFLGEPIPKACLGNDDVSCPMLSPRLYAEFVLPYEQDLVRHAGGLRYWHSCGDVTKLLPLISQLAPIDLIELGAWTDLGQLIDAFPGTPLEICMDPEVGLCDDAARIRRSTLSILETCRKHDADAFYLTGAFSCRSFWWRVARGTIAEYRQGAG